MVITLTDCESKKGTAVKFYFPVVPEQIKYKTAAQFQEYDIINKGPVKIPSGTDVTTIGWECFFPGEKIQSLPFVNASKDGSNTKKSASELHKQLETWKDSGTKLKLNISGTPFSFDVYIEKYEATIQDAYTSIYYSIEFTKAITITVATTSAKKQTTTQRSSKTSSQKKHTVKSGDCLWNIAKKYYGDATKWPKIYNANKSTIESAAKKHGKKSSDNGHWIYPGTVLQIP